MMRAHKLTLACLVALSALVSNTAPAGAATSYANICPSLGTALCTAGSLRESSGLAIDNSSGASAGDVWGEKGGVGKIGMVNFDASGNQLAEIGEGNLPGSAIQIFGNGWGAGGIAVDSITGDVYLSAVNINSGLGVVTKFDSSGVFQFQIAEGGAPQGSIRPLAVAVDPSTGDLYVADGLHDVIDKFTSAGVYIEQFPVTIFAGSASIAVDSKGNLYVGFNGERHAPSQVRDYSSTGGAPIDCPSGTNVVYEDPPFQETSPVSLAVDPSDGHLFIGESNAAEGGFVAEYTAPCATPGAKFGGGEVGGALGIGVNGTTHEVYVDTGGEVLIYSQVTVPDVATGAPAAGITRTSARLSGTVNPDGIPVTSCEFEYGPGIAAVYGHTVECEQTLPLEGNSPITVTAEIKGLTLPPATLMHYRLKAGNEKGHNAGEDETFYTESFPAPMIGALPASNVSQFAATLEGTLKTGEALVNYHFEYGTTTAYGQIAPIPDDYTPITTETVPVAQPVSGLQAGTTYHYRLVASSPGGTNVYGPDETFTTLPVPAPTVETGAASEVGVGSATLSGTIDPHGWDTSYLFEYGPSTAYGSSWPTVQVEMGALEGFQPVVVNVPNLLPGTTYHYRLVATNGGGTSYGQDMTFTTGEYPAQVIQEPVSLQTLLVPSEAVKSPGKKGKKAKKKTKKHPKSRRKARRKKR
jgi:hypothetical protein